MGPPADDLAAAKAFQEFWGPKAELRRFPVSENYLPLNTELINAVYMALGLRYRIDLQDGRIAEAIVWEVPAGERHLILDSLVSYVLRRHLPMGTAIVTFAGCLDSVLAEDGAELSDTESAYRCITLHHHVLAKPTYCIHLLGMNLLSWLSALNQHIMCLPGALTQLPANSAKACSNVAACH